jgi:hypothetical protein
MIPFPCPLLLASAVIPAIWQQNANKIGNVYLNAITL